MVHVRCEGATKACHGIGNRTLAGTPRGVVATGGGKELGDGTRQWRGGGAVGWGPFPAGLAIPFSERISSSEIVRVPTAETRTNQPLGDRAKFWTPLGGGAGAFMWSGAGWRGGAGVG